MKTTAMMYNLLKSYYLGRVIEQPSILKSAIFSNVLQMVAQTSVKMTYGSLKEVDTLTSHCTVRSLLAPRTENILRGKFSCLIMRFVPATSGIHCSTATILYFKRISRLDIILPDVSVK